MIELATLVRIHDNPKSIRRHRRILEELFYLCLNETFEATIQETREQLRGMTNEVYVEFPCSSDSAIGLRNVIYGDDYRAILLSISERHGYYHSSFIRDYMKVSSDSDMRESFNILENILFFNDPIPYNNPKDHFKSRSGYVEISYDEIEGPYIRMHFDLGTTRKEIIDIIDKAFPETSELQAENYNIPKKQYRVDAGLQKKLVMYQDFMAGVPDLSTAVALESSDLTDVEYTADYIRLQRGRMQEEILRFNHDD